MKQEVKEQILKEIHQAPIQELNEISDYGYVVSYNIDNVRYHQAFKPDGTRHSNSIYRSFRQAVMELMFHVDDRTLIEAAERVLTIPS